MKENSDSGRNVHSESPLFREGTDGCVAAAQGACVEGISDLLHKKPLGLMFAMIQFLHSLPKDHLLGLYLGSVKTFRV